MNLENYENDLDKLIRFSNQDNTLELETIFKKYKNNDITITKFENVISLLKGLMGTYLEDKIYQSETLDISFGDMRSPFRLSINDNKNIKKYCSQEHFKDIDDDSLEILTKERVKYLDIDDYGIRFNLKRENVIPMNDTKLVKYKKDWKNINKVFRYKKRFSFVTLDKLFRFDLTILKMSSSKEVAGTNQKRMKKDVKDYMQKYVIEPDYVTNFKEWYDKLKDTDYVELIGKKYNEVIPKKTLLASRVMTNTPIFEIELEYIGNKLDKKDKPKLEIIKEKMIENVGYILQTLNNNYFFETKKNMDMFRDYYTKIMGSYKFQGPNNVTLEMKHVLEHEYEEYENIVSIRKGYAVTDKADGERNLLIIDDKNNAFLMNRKNVIKPLGCKINMPNTIIDGEYIIKNKNKRNICLFMAFDMYIYLNEDVRDRILNRSLEEVAENKHLKSRLEYLKDFFKMMEITYNNTNSKLNLDLKMKKFYYGNSEKYDTKIYEYIQTLKQELDDEDTTEARKLTIINLIKKAKLDTKIFEYSKQVYNNEYVYHIDGLIYTPIYLTLGEEPNVDKKNPYSGRWSLSFKWKPPSENSIDFLVNVLKDKSSQDIIEYKRYKGEIIPFKVLTLKVGYDPKLHTKQNSFRIVNEDLEYASGYNPINFVPTNPYIKDGYKAFIPLNNGRMLCENGEKIFDKDIVEFRYSNDEWIPMRIRDSVSPNDFSTANNVWRSINYPITTQNITTGDIEDYEEETYYYNINKRKDISTKSLGDFHSYIKKNLISDNTKKNGLLLDISCGKLGDLNHWLDAKIAMCVGIDYNRDNLENINNGAANRIIDKRTISNSSLLDNIILIWGDSSKSYMNSYAGKDELNKYYLDVIYGNIKLDDINNSKLRKFYNIGSFSDNNGFDTVSCQFSIHYFFENEEKLDTVLNNVSQSLRIGGKFIGTCLDGYKVFNLLNNKMEVSKMNTETDKVLWKITKLYNENLTNFANNSEGLGLPIDVYFESIGMTTKEYLVNFEYLVEKCKQHGLKLVKIVSFDTIFKELMDSKLKYGEALSMNKDLKEYSFLNQYFVFQK